MQPSHTNHETTTPVWDLPVRLFHWLLAASFGVAYLTEDHFMTLHSLVGYTLCGLLVFRLLWGLIGTRHARFSDFVRPPSEVIDYLKRMAALRAGRHLGHNPAGGAMVLALLLTLGATAVSGMAAYGAAQAAGPLAGLMREMPHWLGKTLEEVHESLSGLTLALIALHLLGVLFASLLHRENLVRAMLDGRKRAPDNTDRNTH
ncbi:MAG: cytochrome B [gamma proteobacterium symbiont of Phacoides pectinatus]